MKRRNIWLLSTTVALILFCAYFMTVGSISRSQLTEYEKYVLEKIEKKRSGAVKADAPEMHALIEREIRTRAGMEQPEYGPNQVMDEFLKAKRRLAKRTGARVQSDDFNFIERGPGNVAGRTRALLLDPDDASGQTWYAGSASGGIWKTIDGGNNWEFISGDIPNLGTNTLAMSAANSSVIYAGTGEHFTSDIDGAGMFKSVDKGASWTQVASPADFSDFRNVSRIVVDPNDENVVIATTRNSVWNTTGFEAAIYKTTDGGSTWTPVRSSVSERYDDIAYDPTDFNTLYVAVDARGVIKSTDGGVTWSDVSIGMSPGGRVEIGISSINPNRLWASVEGGLSGSGSDLYVTSDGAATWSLAVSDDGNNADFLGGQGWYDNYVLAHPFDEDVVYAGGVNNFKFELGSATGEAVRTLSIAENGTEAFMGYVNFGGAYLGGGMDLGTVPFEDLLSVELRFGQGTQMAHRFTVDGQGSGVPPAGYLYQDYVEIPFQAWDIENNVQLMVSFRDQQEDGAWNLIEQNTDGASVDHSREYFYVHSVPYDAANPDASIAQDAGVESNQMYFFWPILQSGATFDANDLPFSTLNIDFIDITALQQTTTNVSDAYGDFDGLNSFPQSSRDQGIHPDQHNAIFTDVDEGNQSFRLMITNDGGVYESVSSTDPGTIEGDFEYVSFGYNTTQFYGADKAPGEDRFIGGMQDNGTWYHSSGTTGGADVDATFGIGGDGFESLWHSQDDLKMIGGAQFNNFRRSLDGGNSWQSATNGFNDNGPFRTRLSHSKQLPDRLFTVGSRGVWKSDDFGGAWEAATMNQSSLWAFTNSTDVEVSYADPDVIWAGARHFRAGRAFFSTDGGETFNPAENYTSFEMGSISGIGTHPSEPNTAYLLFSFAGLPKVIKTEDLGQTWEDISGFDGSGDRGFPDVALNSLFVFPTDPNRIWVGSEIGIVESLNGGDSWNLLESDFPAVNVHDFKLVENTIVIATYGRGIWSVEIPDFPDVPALKSVAVSPTGMLDFKITFTEEFDSTEMFVDNSYILTLYDNGIGDISEIIQNLGIDGFVNVRFDAYREGNKFSSQEESIFVFEPNDVADSYGTGFKGAGADYVGSGFNIEQGSGFSNDALNTPHPYSANSEYFTYLKTPITVSSGNSTITYRDVAIVEPANDVVIVEASVDGERWVTLKSYDASLHSEWETRFNSGEDVTSADYKWQSIDLQDAFAPGEDVLIRFKIVTDSNNQGYGWVIDDLYIQEERPLSVVEPEKLTVSPNPIANQARIRFNTPVSTEISVVDLNGRVVDQIKVVNEETIWTPSLRAGIYLLRYELEGQLESQKVIISN